MTRRNRIIIISGIVIGLILACVLFIIFTKNGVSNFVPALVNRQALAPRIEEVPNPPPVVEEEAPTVVLPNRPAPAEIPEEVYLRQLSRLFVERLGSYSNQNNNQHLTDIMVLATPKMQQYMSTLGIEQSTEYEGVTTRVISTTILSHVGDVASVTVQVQKEIKNTSSSTNEYQDGRVDLERGQDGVWRVAGVFWTTI